MAKPARKSKTRPLRNAEFTRTALMECALDMYQRFGYENTSLKKIGQELHLSGPAMYYHFSSKSELLTEAFARRMDHMIQAHEKLPKELNNVERLWTFTALHLRLQFGTRSHPIGDFSVFGVIHLLVLCEPKHRKRLIKIMRGFLDRLTGILRDGIDEGVFLQVHPVATANAIFGMSNQAPAWFHQGGELTLSDLSSIYANFSLRMVGVAAGKVDKRLQILVNNAAIAEGMN